MKKVAVVMESWMKCFTYAWPSGMFKKIKETDADVNLYIFNSSANWSGDKKYNMGEYNIFNLPDFKDFDGVLLDLNNVKSDGVRENLLDRVRASGVPSIVIGNTYDGFYSVGVNNYDAMTCIMNHLYAEHGCRKFWFLMGPSGHYENMRRDKAIWDCIANKNIPLSDCVFNYGEFDTRSGKKAFKQLMEKGTFMPDAIVCANDNIAVGVLDEAEKCGLRAPKDFLVTGFDDLDKSRYYNPRVSTISFVREDVGYTAMEMFMDIWSGKHLEKIRYTDWTPIFWESCGCTSDVMVDVRQHMKNEILMGEENQVFEEAVFALNDSLAYCNSIKEMMDCIPECLPSLNCDAMYLVCDTHLKEIRKTVDIKPEMYMELLKDPFLTEGYPDDMQIVFAYENELPGNKHTESMPVNGIFPMFDCDEKGVDFLFLPLHFREKCIGYFAIRNAIYLMEKQYIFDIISTITKALEELYGRGQLARMNSALSALYSHDAMTMLYNRIGLLEVGDNFYKMKKLTGERLLITYVDLDFLKMINDTYGHANGDFAIKKMAEILLKYSGEDKLVFRLGGDEFLMINYYDNDETVKKQCRDMQLELKEAGEKEKFPVELSMSYGYVVTDPNSEMVLDDYISRADDLMYKYKVEHKKQRK